MNQKNDKNWVYSVIIYADDIILIAYNMQQLQRLLDICTSWATKNTIKYGTDKCYYLADPSPKFPNSRVLCS